MVLYPHSVVDLLLLSNYVSPIPQQPMHASQASRSPWESAGAESTWINQTLDAVVTMQSLYWNGTYWPTTIEWIGAFINTVVAAVDETFTSALALNQTGITSDEIESYYNQTEAYFQGENTTQIFGAAYDDAQWVVLEWLEVSKFINQYDSYANTELGKNQSAKYAHRAHIFYNIVQNQFNTSTCDGGITWNPSLEPYKNAITNELFIASSISMYLYYAGDNDPDPYPSPDYTSRTNLTLPPLPALAAHDPLLLGNAVKEYQWFKAHNFTNAQGLIVDGFHVSEGQKSCDQRNEMVYSYNQGVILSGLRGLWEATGNVSYLDDGYSLINTTMNATGWNVRGRPQAPQWAALGRNGTMEDYCDAAGDCAQDNLVFKGAYFHHLDLFCERLPTDTPLVPGLTEVASPQLAVAHAQKCDGYFPWIEHNALAALNTRNASNVMGEWWGMPSMHETQLSSGSWAVNTPTGSVDIRNQPWLLERSPCRCFDQDGCHSSAQPAVARLDLKKRDVDDQVRTVETQAQGLAVVKCAASFMLRMMSG